MVAFLAARSSATVSQNAAGKIAVQGVKDFSPESAVALVK